MKETIIIVIFLNSINMGGSISIRNDTDWPLLISLEQLTPLYWQMVQPGHTFYRETGAVHFTIKAKVALKDTIDVVKDCVLPIAAVSGLGIGVAGLALTSIPGVIGIGTVAGTLGLSEATVLTATKIGAFITAGSIISQAIIIQQILSQTAKQKGYQSLDEIISSDQIRHALKENLQKKHYQIKKYNYYAGFNHKLKIVGGISFKKLLQGEYQAENLSLIQL